MDDELVRDIVSAATQAPSVHNTQPWLFVATGESVQVWSDPDRSLPVLDPDGRAVHISCGAAVALGQAYAVSRGLSCAVTLLPDSAEPQHLADLLLDAGPEPTDEQRALGAAVARRHTDRRPFATRAVPEELVRRMAAAARQEGCSLTVVRSVDDAAAVAVTLARADDLLSRDSAYLDELRRWSGREAASTDGVPTEAAGPAPAGRASSFRLRDFDPDTAGSGATTSRSRDLVPPPAEHPLVVVLATEGDDPRSWLLAGRALGRVLLTVDADGLASSPMTQALEVADTRARLRADLGLVGHPQMVLRVGFPAPGPPAPAGGRRPLTEVLRTAP